MRIPLDCIDGYWTKLDMSPSILVNCEVVDDLGSRSAEELEMKNQCFSVSNNSKKIMLLKRLRELVILAKRFSKLENVISVFQS